MNMVKPLTYGRMGNFLFQAAAAMGYAWRNGLQFTLPDTTNDTKANPIYLQHLVNPAWDPSLPEKRIKENGHGYQVLEYSKSWNKYNIILDGYWQSEKYFKEFRDRIIDHFGYPWESRKGVVSFHVRRGDYLTLTRKHPPVTIAWMERAMALFPFHSFKFFSDDIAWCKKTFGNRSNCHFSDGVDEEEDLIGISCCEHHICSASTFSWWGAWLNRNPKKTVVMPNWWFTPGYKKTDTSDIVPPEWKRLD